MEATNGGGGGSAALFGSAEPDLPNRAGTGRCFYPSIPASASSGHSAAETLAAGPLASETSAADASSGAPLEVSPVCEIHRGALRNRRSRRQRMIRKAARVIWPHAIYAVIPALFAVTASAAARAATPSVQQPRPTAGSSASPTHAAPAAEGLTKLSRIVRADYEKSMRAGREVHATSQYILELTAPSDARLERAIRRAGGAVVTRMRRVPMAVARCQAGSLIRIAALPQVRWIDPDLRLSRTLEYANPAVGASGGAWTGDSMGGFSGYTGKGVGVAVVDSGINGVDDISKSGGANGKACRITTGYDWTTSPARSRTMNDDEAGHGTCVAGIIAGNGYDSSLSNDSGYTYRHFVGIAPEASLINLRILDSNGHGTVSSALAALDWVIQNASTYNIRVVNLSMGHPPVESYSTDALCQACESVWKAGVLVVCAAGNRGRVDPNNASGGTAYGTIDSPGDDPYVLTVGAANDMGTANRGDDLVTSYSSRGPTSQDFVLKPDIVAPGNKIIAMRNPNGYLESVVGPQNKVSPSYYWMGTPTATTGYFMFSGTSMAAPMVSGAAAILFQKDPTLTPDTVKARLMRSADKVWRSDGSTDDVFSRGAGYLNIPAALADSGSAAGSAVSPTCTLNSDGSVSVNANQAIWGDPASWSASNVWGNPASWNSGVVSGDQALWGKTVKSSSSTVWDNSSIQSDFSGALVNGD